MLLLVSLLSAVWSAGAFAQESIQPVRIGMIGLDTSHCIAFTRLLNDDSPDSPFRGCHVVCAYPHGSADIESSVSRIPKYTRQIESMGVEIADSIDQLVSKVDAVLLETNDGRLHLEQALPVLRAGKPVFIDKPMAASLADVIAIFDAASHFGTPVFSSSSLRFSKPAIQARKGELVGKVLGCETWSPATLEPTHPDLYWYGIHGVEQLFTVMGTGCQSVIRTSTDSTDVVTGVWNDGRIGSFRGTRNGVHHYGGTVFGKKGESSTGGNEGYQALVQEIARFFRTGEPPVEPEETIEIYAFMSAADESKNDQVRRVSLADTIRAARIDAQRRLAEFGIRISATDSERATISENGCGRATAYSKSNKIVTVDEMTHVSWLDSIGKDFVVRVCTLNNETNEWSSTFDVGSAEDNHGGPALAVDSNAYLHVVYGPHHGPMSYRRSVRPNDASEWSDEVQFGDKLTYPTLVVAPDDTLVVVCRKSFSNEPWAAVICFRSPQGEWSEPSILIRAGEPGYSQFNVSLAWGPDHKTLHLATRMFGDTPAWGYGVCYMKSEDAGRTWIGSRGNPIDLPATRGTMDSIYSPPVNLRNEYISGSALGGGAVAVDSENIPHVLYHSLSKDGLTPHQTWIATPDTGTGEWNRLAINERINVCSDDSSLSTPGGFSIADDGSWNLALTLTDRPESAGDPFGTRQNEVIWARSRDGGETFESAIVSSTDNEVPDWLPNIERPTGFNPVDNPALIFTSGIRGANLTDILNNRVVWFRVR